MFSHEGATMQESPKLTDRQQQILDLVQSAIERTGAPPTRAEIANELGTRNAAPTPCRQRAATSTQPLGATAHNSDDTAKTTSPNLSTTSRPKASEIAPAMRMSAPRVSR